MARRISQFVPVFCGLLVLLEMFPALRGRLIGRVAAGSSAQSSTSTKIPSSITELNPVQASRAVARTGSRISASPPDSRSTDGLLALRAGTTQSPPSASPQPCDGILDDFEYEGSSHEFSRWNTTGIAFNNQPFSGDPSILDVLPPGFRPQIATEIGGNYWNSPWPNGHQGNYWVSTGTGDSRPGAGDATGYMDSSHFLIQDSYIYFLLGGGDENTTVLLEVQAPIDVNNPSAPSYREFVMATGTGSPMMRRVVYQPPAWTQGHAAFIRVVDNSPYASIAVDDFGCSNQPPAGQPPSPVWGLADLHTHPRSDLGFGARDAQGTGSLFYGSPLGPIDQALAPCNHGHNATADSALAACFALNGTIGGVGFEGMAALFLWRPLQFVLAVIGPIPAATLGATLPQILTDNIGEQGRARQSGSLAGAIVSSHNSNGFGTFDQWPYYDTLIHQQMHRDWIQRAYQGGLRLMVADVVNNRLLSRAMGHETFDSFAFSNELPGIVALVNQNPWMEIAYTPGQARAIIQRNHLAVVLGIELDEPETLLLNDPATSGLLDQDNPKMLICVGRKRYSIHPGSETTASTNLVSYLIQNGIRHVIPIHLANNSFGGSAINDGVFNTLNVYLHDSTFGVSDGSPYGVSFTLPSEPVTSVEYSVPNYTGHVNAQGFTSAGRTFLAEMKRQGMIADVSHMDELEVNEMLGLGVPTATPDFTNHGLVFPGTCTTSSSPACQSAAYPVIASHTGFRDQMFEGHQTERDVSPEQAKQIIAIGGVIGLGDAPTYVPSTCLGSVRSWLALYKKAVDLTGGRALGFGTDANGLNGMTFPLTSDSKADPYPCNGKGDASSSKPEDNPADHATEPASLLYLPANDSSSSGIVQSQSGSRAFDFNTDGWAHYGMMADFLQDAQNLGGGLQPMFRSAEDFVEAWEKSCRIAASLGGGMACKIPANVASGSPVVSEVTPSQTQCGASVTVTISGANLSNANSVGFYKGMTQLYNLNFTVVSDSQIDATIPNAVDSGLYDIIVNTPQGSSVAVNQDRFLVRPTVSSISPAVGPFTGGTEVTVNGACLGGDIFFGSAKAVGHSGGGCSSSTLCVVLSPASASPGAVDVVVNLAGVLSTAHLGDVFMYGDHPTLTRLEMPDLSSWLANGAVSPPGVGVYLNGYAPAPGAAITFITSDPSVAGTAVPTVTIPAGLQDMGVALTVSPTAVAKIATLTAQYQGSYVTAALNVPPWPPIIIGTQNAHLYTGDSTTVTVTLNAPAPPGAAVSLVPTPQLTLPMNVSIPAGSYNASFKVEGKYSGPLESVKIEAGYNGASATCYVQVECKPRSCDARLGLSWHPETCACQKGGRTTEM